MSPPSEARRRYTIVMDLWRAPGDDIEKFEGAENPELMDVVDEARFNLDAASRASEAAYWLSQRGWTVQGAYDAVVLNTGMLTRSELAKHLLLAGLQRQVVEEYDSPASHRPSRLVHMNLDTLDVEEWPNDQSLEHDPDHCPLCLRSEPETPEPPEAEGVLQEAEMILAAARFKDVVRRAGLRLPEVLALFFGYSQGRQLEQEEVYPLIEQYKEYRADLHRRGVIEE